MVSNGFGEGSLKYPCPRSLDSNLRMVSRIDTVDKIRHALEKAGVEFTNGKRLGVRLKTR